MKKVLLFVIISCFVFVFQVGAQEKVIKQTEISDKASIVPVKTTVIPQTGVMYNVSASNREAVNSKVLINPLTIENKDNHGNINVAEKQDVSNIPLYIVNTGNPEKDLETLRKAKEEWISKNPEKYRPSLNHAK